MAKLSLNKKWYPKPATYNKICAFIIGTGIALSAIHNTWLTQIFTNEEGVVNLFLPSLGMALWFIGTLVFIANNYKDISLGSKWVYIPLLVIVLAIALSGIGHGGVVPLFMGLGLFGLYLVSRVLTNDIYAPLMIGAVIASLAVVAFSVVNPGVENGGYVFQGNYDIVVGYILSGAILYKFKRQSWIVSLALVAMLLTGSPEAVFVVAVTGFIYVIACGLSFRKSLLVIMPFFITLAVLVASGVFRDLYHYVFQVMMNEVTVTGQGHTIVPGSNGTAVGYRLHVISTMFKNIEPFGSGYSITNFSEYTVHNVPLIIVQQLGYPGMVAAAAFIFVSVFLVFKSKNLMALVLIINLCVFDHYVWTQLAPLWWVIIGESSIDI